MHGEHSEGKSGAPGRSAVLNCPECAGTGKAEQVIKDCPACGGIGYLADAPCDNCETTGKVNVVNPNQPVEDILDEAKRITDHDRNALYGDPEDNFARIAKAWETIFGIPIAPTKVPLAMIMVKVIREAHAPKRDNWVDCAGYARCGWRAAGKP